MKQSSIDAEIKKTYQQGEDVGNRYPDFKIPESFSPFQKLCALRQEVLEIRNLLNPILDGEIQKGHNTDPYAIRPEFRKTSLKDARRLCRHAYLRLNAFAGYFEDEGNEP